MNRAARNFYEHGMLFASLPSSLPSELLVPQLSTRLPYAFYILGQGIVHRYGRDESAAGCQCRQLLAPVDEATRHKKIQKRARKKEREHSCRRGTEKRGGLTGVQQTRMLCMQMRADRPIREPLLFPPAALPLDQFAALLGSPSRRFLAFSLAFSLLPCTQSRTPFLLNCTYTLQLSNRLRKIYYISIEKKNCDLVICKSTSISVTVVLIA